MGLVLSIPYRSRDFSVSRAINLWGGGGASAVLRAYSWPSAQGLFLVVLEGSYLVLGTELRSAEYKGNAFSVVLALQLPQIYVSKNFIWGCSGNTPGLHSGIISGGAQETITDDGDKMWVGHVQSKHLTVPSLWS